jgi:hypothetical protein
MSKFSLLSKFEPVNGWNKKQESLQGFEQEDLRVKLNFSRQGDAQNINRYHSLFKYFLSGFVNYKSPLGALALYPGAKSCHGIEIDGLEGFSRFFPLAASWITFTGERSIEIGSKYVDIIDLLRSGIIAGTDPSNHEYWGLVGDGSQRIVEAADIALGLWLTRDYLWPEFSNREQQNICTWLNQVKTCDVLHGVGCNWELFPIITMQVLSCLDMGDDQTTEFIRTRYQHYKRHFLGEGWFYDSPKGEDYYNAWAINYGLFWLDQMNPNLDREFLRACHADFVKFYRYFFSENGFPIMGRSICYRMAAPAPIVFGALVTPEIVSPGLAYRTLDATWRYFIKHDSLKYGGISQGYLGTDLSILDRYSGPASCLWSLRSLVAAFYVAKFVGLWEAPEQKLPIEASDFSIHNDSVGWHLVGCSKTQEIKLFVMKNSENPFSSLKSYNNVHKFIERLFRKPYRPDNSNALYLNRCYSNYNSALVQRYKKQN